MKVGPAFFSRSGARSLGQFITPARDEVKPDENAGCKPDIGDIRDWNRWFDRAWRLLDPAELVQLKTPLDVARVCGSGDVLNWLAFDYVAAAFRVSDEIYWSDWVEAYLLTDPMLSILAMECAPVSDLDAMLAGSQLMEDVIGDDELRHAERLEWMADEMAEKCRGVVAARLVRECRPPIVAALLAGYGSASEMFVELHSAATGEADYNAILNEGICFVTTRRRSEWRDCSG